MLSSEKLDQLKGMLAAVNGLLYSMNRSLNADSDNVWKYAGFKQFVWSYNQIVKTVAQLIPIGNCVVLFDYEKIPGPCNTVAIQQKEYFEAVHVNASILRGFIESNLNINRDEIGNLKHFIQANLRRAILRKPDKELDIQDTIEQILIGRDMAKGIDYDREVGRIKVSSKEVVPDFIFPRLQLALEVKFSTTKTKSKTIIDEINADIKSYGKKYPFVLFVVYDLGTIRDEVEFREDLEKEEGVSVVIVKH